MAYAKPSIAERKQIGRKNNNVIGQSSWTGQYAQNLNDIVWI